MSDDFFRLHLADSPIIAILRGMSPDETVRLACRCWDAGIRLVEVPAQGAGGLAALRAAVDAGRARGTSVGAGTILTPDVARAARDAGAAFLVAPGLDTSTIRFAREAGIPLLPGVTTPSEIMTARSLGTRVVKLFPASLLGPAWVTAIHGPLPDIDVVAVGGITPANATEFLLAGALGVGVGGALGTGDTIEILARIESPVRWQRTVEAIP